MKKRAALRQGKPSSNGRGKKSRPIADGGSISLKWKKNDEEISSDDESDQSNKDHIDEDSEEEGSNVIETAEEKRRRLARGYLEQMGSLIQTEEDEDSHGEDFDAHLSERLKLDRLQRKGKYYREFGEHFESLDLEQITSRHLYGHKGAITAVALTTDETAVFTGSKDNSIVRWDTETGQQQELKRKWNRTEDDKQCHEGEVLSVAVSSDGRYVVGGGKDNWIRVYDKRSKYAEVHVFKNHKEPISGLIFQTDTYALFSASHDRCIKYWDLNEMGYIETLFGHQDTVHALDCWQKLRPVSVSNDRSIRSWKVAESSHLVYRGHKGPIDAIQILTEESFVSGSQDGRLCLWKDSKKTPISTVVESHGLESGSARWISSVASIKASDIFASGSNDGFVRIWSTKNEKINQVNAFPMLGFVNGLAISSRLLVAGCGREHRLGRWWNMKKCKDRLTIVRFPQDLSHLVTVDEDDEEEEDSDSYSNSDVVASEESESDN